MMEKTPNQQNPGQGGFMPADGTRRSTEQSSMNKTEGFWSADGTWPSTEQNPKKKPEGFRSADGTWYYTEQNPKKKPEGFRSADGTWYCTEQNPEKKPEGFRSADGSWYSTEQNASNKPERFSSADGTCCCSASEQSSLYSNLEFPPLSLQQVEQGKTMPGCNPVDQMVLNKCTPTPPGQEEFKVQKDLSQVISCTEEMINYGCKQGRHLNAVTLELKLLLKYEQKILNQVVSRIDKFKKLRDENKRKTIEWENQYKAKVPEYDSYSTKLINVPHTESISVDGVSGPVQEKILFQIVSRTTNTANRVVVQLSMEEAVANDIDLTLQDLKKHCAVMLKQIGSWLKIIDTQITHQDIVCDRWIECKTTLKDMKDKDDSQSMIGATNTNNDGKNIAQQLKPYEERLKRIEEAICKLCQTVTDPYDQRLKTIEEAICKMNYSQQCQYSPYSACHVSQGGYSDPYCDPLRGTFSSGTPTDQCISHHSPDHQSPNFHTYTPISDGYMENAFFPSPGFGMCSPCPPCPDFCSPQGPQVICSPTADDYFVMSMGSPAPGAGQTPVQGATSPMEYTDLGELRRNRAPPGAFPGIDLVDCPGMGFPVPRAALERGGRPPGQVVPLTPPPPTPPHMGRFAPLATSSPARGEPGVLRPPHSPAALPPNPMQGQPMDPALLPKIQEDLQKLGERNRNLQDLVNNFKTIRATLTDAIDKAVKLNQRLQRDLYYVAEAHK